jgi:ParB-like chromosome segregation protein Spo0J
MKDPFNPETGEFAKNIRSLVNDDDSELRQSLRAFGWDKRFPAFVDENGVMLVGHRRAKIAKELGIEPATEVFNFGQGEAADAERLKLAIISNAGPKPLNKNDRQRLAMHLYGKAEWTMEKIAEALNVSTKQISRDLSNFDVPSKSKPAKTASNPKGAGRPKGSGAKPADAKPENDKPAPKPANADKAPAPKRKTGEVQAQRSINVKPAIWESFKTRVEMEGGVVAAKIGELLTAYVDGATVDPSTLPLNAQQKIDAVIRRYKQQLDAEFRERVSEEVRKRIDEIVLPHWKQQIDAAKTLYERRRALMDKATFNKIRRGLHPDSRNSISDRMLGEAFDAFMALEKYLLSEKDSPTSFDGLPSSVAEWDKMRKRPAKRGNASGAVKRR